MKGSAISMKYVFTEAGMDVLTREGIRVHTVSTAPFPAVPIAGDLISWDWLAGGRSFIVIERKFIWTGPRDVAVQLLLDCPVPPTNENQNGS
jgi:hypothetical protein